MNRAELRKTARNGVGPYRADDCFDPSSCIGFAWDDDDPSSCPCFACYLAAFKTCIAHVDCDGAELTTPRERATAECSDCAATIADEQRPVSK